MWLEQVIRRESGCASYVVGSDRGGCVVFDPLWDVSPVVAAARRHGSPIRYVVDSHSHADHVSGARRLAQRVGAPLVLPELAEVEYDFEPLAPGARLAIGELELEALALPGHRPEQIGLLVFDRSRGVEPWCLLSADSLLVGDVARPDLAQGGEEGAAVLWKTTLPALARLPDWVEVYPGHLAGST